MVLQQIREQEEKESKTKKNKQMRTIREEQDFEYEETLQKDKILLVDDVITSGATIYGCLKAIQNENSKITVAALAVNSEDLF